jgi:ribonuclease E
MVPPKFHDQPEFIMMTTKSRLLTKVSCGLSVAFLAFAYTSTVSAVRAQSDVPTWMMTDPISTTVKALEDRIAGLEAKIASLTSQQSADHELCVSDGAGARTCISKAQLDRLLKMMQTAAIDEPAKTADRLTSSISESVAESVTEPAKVESIVESTVESAEAAPAAPAAETQAAAVEAPAQIETTTAAVVEEPAQIETTTAAVVEAPRQAEKAEQAALPEDTINPDSMPTGSIPAPTQGDALVTQPEVEITTPPAQPTEQ